MCIRDRDKLSPAAVIPNAHSAAINDLIWLPGAATFISCSEDLTIKVWVEQPGNVYANCAAQQTDVPPCALAWDGCRQWLFVGLESGHLLVLALVPDFSQFNLVTSFPLHEDRITSIRFDPVTDSVVTVSRDRGLCVYNISLDQTRGGQVSSSWISALELYYPYVDVPVALCATYESSILLVDCRKQNPKKVHALNQHGGSVRCLYFDSGSKLLFSSGFDMVIILWRLIGTQVKLVQKLVGHRKKVNGVVYSAGRNRVISAGDDEAIFVWDPNSAKPTFSVPFAHEGAVEHITWVEEKNVLVTCGEDLAIKVWKFDVDDTPSADSLSQAAVQWKQMQAGQFEGSGPVFELPKVSNVITAQHFVQPFERAMQSLVCALRTCPNLTLENASWNVQAMLSAVEDRLRSNVEASEEAVFDALELAEGFIMSQLHERVFGTSEDDKREDLKLASRLKQLGFLEPCHLEIPEDIPLDCDSFEEARRSLCGLSQYKIPSKMIDGVVHCCRCIHDVIRQAKEQIVARKHQLRARDANGEVDEEQVRLDAQQAAASAGADEFLPIFIYVVLISYPPALYSCLQYVQRFRLLTKMGSEGGCFFTHLNSAVYFLENLTSSSLAIDPAVYDYYINGCKVRGLRVGEPAIRSNLFEDEDEEDVTADQSIGSPDGLFGDLSSMGSQLSFASKARGRHARNPHVAGLFSEEEPEEEKERNLRPGAGFGMGQNKSGSPQVLAHLLHAMDDDLESDNLFTSSDVQRVAPTLPPRTPNSSLNAAENLLRELELEGDDDDEFTFPEPEAAVPTPARAATGGISLGDAATSLADLSALPTGESKSWDLDEDEVLPTPVQWESPATVGSPGEPEVLEAIALPPAAEDAVPGEADSPGGVVGSRLSAITAMFEQKIAVAEEERRSQHRRAQQKKGNSSPWKDRSTSAVEANMEANTSKEVFFSDLMDSD
eukprot:TRINITY_DN2483_c0_g1_i4.p1 TRINITY_DN2483_c0_g1~~TRINITY_DN2483_c0_g1_i4.p1  ORF type:complete len:947 (-),score=255.34 TRINITY_DN2483_c0_g1_i4:138-2978(-)